MRARTMLVLGLAIREAFSFWTGHPFDFEVWVRTGYWVAHGVTPYAPLPFVQGLSFANDFGGPGFQPAVGYLPLWPLLCGAIYDLFSVIGAGNRFVYYFMLKQPVILGDVLLAFLIYLYVQRERPEAADKALALWLFSPLPIILSGIWGIFDGLAMAVVMLGLVAPAGRTRALWEGLAIFVKSIPVIFILPLGYSRDRKVSGWIIAIAVPVLLTVAAVFLAGWPWVPPPGSSSAVIKTLASTLPKKGFPLSLWGTLLYLNLINVVPSSTVTWITSWAGYLWIPAVAVASLLAWRWFGFKTDRGVVHSMLLVTFVFLLARGQVNEQYAVYSLALVLLDAALWSPPRMRLFYAMTAVVLAALVTNNFLLIRFLSPIYPGALQLESTLVGEVYQLKNAVQYAEGLAFCALNIWYIALLVRERRRWYDL